MKVLPSFSTMSEQAAESTAQGRSGLVKCTFSILHLFWSVKHRDYGGRAVSKKALGKILGAGEMGDEIPLCS